MKSFRLLLIFIVTAGLVACVPLSSKNPFGHKANDPALVGTWANDEFRMVIERKGRGRVNITLSSPDAEDDEQFGAGLPYSALTSRIEGENFMSVKQKWTRDLIKAYAKDEGISLAEARRNIRRRDKRLDGWYLAWYKITVVEEVDQLDIYLLDEDSEVVASALENGELRGGEITVTTEEGDETEILYVTSSSRQLDDFVSTHIDDLETLFDFDMAGFKRQ